MQVALLLRYKVNFAGRLVTAYVLFAIIFYGGQTVANRVGGVTNLGGGLEGIIVGWFLLTMVQGAYGSLPKAIKMESRRGTLEQLYVTPYGFGRLMLSRVVVQMLLSVFSGTLMLGLMLLTTRRTLAIDVITIVPIILFTLLSVVGLGLLLAGLTLVYKKVSSLIGIVRLLIMGLVGAPLVDLSFLRYLPVAQGSLLLQETMAGSTSIWQLPVSDLAILCLTGLGYFLLGYAVFLYCLTVARRRGVMGHY